MSECSTRARSPRRRTPRPASVSAGSAGSTPRRIWSSPAAASMRIPARTPPSTRSSPIPTRHASPITFLRCHTGQPTLLATCRSCARARSSRCRTAATTAARTASSGRRAASHRAFPRESCTIACQRRNRRSPRGDRAVRRRPRVVRTRHRDRPRDAGRVAARPLRRKCAHPAQQRQRERCHRRADRAQRTSAALLALAHPAAKRQRSCCAQCIAAIGARNTCAS